MAHILTLGATSIWHDSGMDEYYVYHGVKLIRVCPSLGMAREIAEGR